MALLPPRLWSGVLARRTFAFLLAAVGIFLALVGVTRSSEIPWFYEVISYF
jgi:hypothetical protein